MNILKHIQLISKIYLFVTGQSQTFALVSLASSLPEGLPMNQEAMEDYLTLPEIRVSSTFALLRQRRAQIHCPGGESIGSIGAGIFCCPKQITFLVVCFLIVLIFVV